MGHTPRWRAIRRAHKYYPSQYLARPITAHFDLEAASGGVSKPETSLRYLGYLAGHRGVGEAMADPAMRGFVAAYLDEVKTTVAQAPGIDIQQYAPLPRR